MSLSELLRQSGLAADVPSGDLPVLDLTDDSRSARPGSLFVCLRGFRTDGHRYAPDAYAGGCRLFVCEHPLDLPEDAVQVRVEDTSEILPALSAAFYGEPSRDMTLFGITGTKGKTTQAWLLHELLNLLCERQQGGHGFSRQEFLLCRRLL